MLPINSNKNGCHIEKYQKWTQNLMEISIFEEDEQEDLSGLSCHDM
jgi:hypothetical protein